MPQKPKCLATHESDFLSATDLQEYKASIDNQDDQGQPLKIDIHAYPSLNSWVLITLMYRHSTRGYGTPYIPLHSNMLIGPMMKFNVMHIHCEGMMTMLECTLFESRDANCSRAPLTTKLPKYYQLAQEGIQQTHFPDPSLPHSQ